MEKNKENNREETETGKKDTVTYADGEAISAAKTFGSMGVDERIVKALKGMGITEPTDIQEQAMPLIRAGKDVIGMSKTGSGKTATFGVPILESMESGAGLQALIVTPTRELAHQISGELMKFGRNLGFNVATVFGGVALGPQAEKLRVSEIVVGTPGRLLDHIQRRSIDLSRIKIVVLDEADKMAEMGFIEDVERILSQTPKKKQMLLFGATLSDEINMLKKRHMHEPSVVKAAAQVEEDYLKQYYYNIEPQEKFSLLLHLLKEENVQRAIVFCSSRSTVELVAKNLRLHRIKAEMLHGKLTQNRRLSVIKDLDSGKTNLIVASPVAARGLDIRDITHIFNYDLSADPQEYIHRIGRTARAGESGKAITLLSSRDYEAFSGVLQRFDVKVELLPRENFEMVRFDARRSHEGGGGQFRGRPGTHRRSGYSGAGPRRHDGERYGRDGGSRPGRTEFRHKRPGHVQGGRRDFHSQGTGRSESRGDARPPRFGS